MDFSMNAQSAPAPLDILLRAIQEAMRIGVHDTTQSLSSLVSQAESVLRAHESLFAEDQEHSQEKQVILHRDQGELAFTLISIMHHAQDQGLHKRCLKLLARLGAAAERYGVAYLCSGKSKPDLLISMMETIPAEERLMLLNAFLQRVHLPAENIPQALIQRLRSLCAETITDDPEEGLVLLEKLADRGETPANALQHSMHESRFGIWLEELLRMELSNEQIMYMSKAVKALRSPALATSLCRHAKRLTQEELVEYLHTLSHCPGTDNTAPLTIIQQFSADTSPVLRDAALRAQHTLAPESILDVLTKAMSGNTSPTPALYPLLLLLDAETFTQFFKAIPSEKRPALLSRLGLILATYDKEAIINLLKQSENGQTMLGKAQEFLAQHTTSEFTPLFEPELPPQTPPEEPEEEPTGLLASMKGLLKSTTGEGEGIHPLTRCTQGASYTAERYEQGTATGLALTKNTFTGCTFTRMDMSYLQAKTVRFTNCTFTLSRFSSSRLVGVQFVNCTFTNCFFNKSLIDRSTFTGCTFNICNLGESIFKKSFFDGCTIHASRMWGTHLAEVRVAKSLISAMDASYTVWRKCAITGSDFYDCSFVYTDIRGLIASESHFYGCVNAGCRASNLQTRSPFLLAMEIEWYPHALQALAEDTEDLALPQANTAVFLFLQQWLQQHQDNVRACRILAYNNRRRTWAKAKLGSKADFLEMLPILLKAPVIPTLKGKGASFADATPAVLEGFSPSRRQEQCIADYFGEAPPETDSAQLTIHSIFLIGGTGTIGQAQESPLEIWLMHTANAEHAKLLPHFSKKLENIAEWGKQEFGLTVKFLLMDTTRFRENNFGFAHGTDVTTGRSQALLLKAEFYRTALLLTGRPPAWWMTPPDSDDAQYIQRVASLSRSVNGLNLLDLGSLESIPTETFFSSLIWYIARALSIPFNSLLAFGLLDKYAEGTTETTLLCNTIKRRIHNGLAGIWHTDALAVPLRDIFVFYQKKEQTEVLDLLRHAFLRKCGYTTMHISSKNLGSEYAEDIFPYSDDPVGKQLGEPIIAENTPPSMLEMVELGEQLRRYLLNTYVDVTKRLGTIPDAGTVPQEDLAKAGRKISAWLEPKTGKLMRLPFIAPPHQFLNGLEIRCEVSPAQTAEWSIFARLPVSKGREKGKELIKVTSEPEQLLCWLVANQIWQPGVDFRSTSLVPNVTLTDINAVLSIAHTTFPPDCYDRPWDEYVADEQVIRALVIANVGIAKEARGIERAVLLYLTNWGELFYVSKLPTPAKWTQAPAALLRNTAHCAVASGAAITLHLPQRLAQGIETTITV